jgi:hypothetical protein
MRFCQLLLVPVLALGCLAETPKSTAASTLRGKLTQQAGQPPAIETPDHKLIALEGDEAAIKTLQDKRLNGFELEAKGHYTSADHFRIDPIHARSVLVRKDGKLKMITYWCDVCSIRSYEPGPCWCCQQETVLDLRDPDQP